VLGQSSQLARFVSHPEEFLARVLENDVSAVTVVARDGQIIYANAAAERLHGIDRARILERTFDDPDWWITALDGTPLSPDELPFTRVLARGEPVAGAQHAIHWPDGKRRYLSINGAPLWGDDGGEVEAVVFSIEDITERIEYQDRLRRMAVVFESTREGVIITNDQGRIERVNPAFTQITGYTEAEVIGRNPNLLSSGLHDKAFYQAMWATINETGSWQGEIWNRRKNGQVYPEWLTINRVTDDNGDLAHFVAVFSDITQVKQSEDELEHLAHHDPLTDLPNRLLLHARLEQAMKRADQSGTLLGVVFLDIDRFKDINSSRDHAQGDRIIVEAANRFAEAVGAEHTLARFGGDEFLIVLEGLTQPHQIQPVLGRLQQAMAPPFLAHEDPLQLTVSAGCSFYPQDGRSEEALLRNADAALAEAKEAGGGTCRTYSPDMTDQIRDRLALERALQTAIEQDELEVHYQGQWSLADRHLVGVEALVRWRHPRDGLISPGRFIPLAEDSGLILPLGEWVLRDACHQARAWLDQGIDFGRVGVNVAVPQLQNGDLAASVAEALAAAGLPGHRLELEVTESSLLSGGETSLALFDQLRELGVTLAVDDFGTGYSSLSYLKRLPIDRIKLDKGFVQDVTADGEDAVISRAVINMGRSLGLKVLAEGVESQEQCRFLEAEGAHEVQGFLWHRPEPDPDWADLIPQAPSRA